MNVVVVDGRAGAPYDSISNPPAVTEDGSVIAYSARRGDRQFCVVNESEGPAFDRVDPPIISRDGRRIAYAAGEGDRSLVVVDGRRGEAFRWVSHLAFSPDGRRLAFAAEFEPAPGDYRYRIIVDGCQGPDFQRVGTPSFSADGASMAYGAREAGRWFVCHDNRRLPAQGPVASVFLDPTGARVGWVEEQGTQLIVATEHRRGAPFDWIGWPALTGAGRLVYFGSRGPDKFVILDDREMALGDVVVWDPELSPDGRRLRFKLRIGRELRMRSIPL